MGSGSTCLACVDLKRNFIGYELDKNYFKIAEERLKKKETQANLFDNCVAFG